MFLSMHQAEEYDRVINTLTDERTDLEEKYFRVRSEYVSVSSMLDELKIKAESKERLLNELKSSKQDDLSNKLIALTDVL